MWIISCQAALVMQLQHQVAVKKKKKQGLRNQMDQNSRAGKLSSRSVRAHVVHRGGIIRRDSISVYAAPEHHTSAMGLLPLV